MADQIGLSLQQIADFIGLHDGQNQVGIGLPDLHEGMNGLQVKLVPVAGAKLGILAGVQVQVALPLELHQVGQQKAAGLVLAGDDQVVGILPAVTGKAPQATALLSLFLGKKGSRLPLGKE